MVRMKPVASLSASDCIGDMCMNACGPRLPVGAASHCVSGSNQIDNDQLPRQRLAMVGHFVVRLAGGFGPVMNTSYHAGSTR